MDRSLIKLFLFFVLLFVVTASSQERSQKFLIPDSLKDNTFDELVDKYYSVKPNITLQDLYAKTFLSKAKMAYDTVKIARGYHFLAYLHNDSNITLAYTDSIIDISQRLNHDKYPSVGYILKGSYYYQIRDFKKALDYNLIGLKYIEKTDNLNRKIGLHYNIGLIRMKIGFFEDALSSMKIGLNYANINDYKNTKPDTYYTYLFAVSTVYSKLKKLDSATYYNKQGIRESLSRGDSTVYYKFVVNQGIVEYKKNKLASSKDSIIKSIYKLKDLDRVFAHFYLGKIYQKNDNIELCIENLKKVDTIFLKYSHLDPELRETYDMLISYYKSKKDEHSELIYVKRLLSLDSILDENYKYLSNKIYKEYDTPRLIQKKNTIISSLKKKEDTSTKYIIILLLILCVVLVVLAFNLKKRLLYKKRFEALIGKNQKNEEIHHASIKKIETISIADDVINKILEDLKDFERNKVFLRRDITSSMLAKKLNTNTTYLSKTINASKQKSFVQYLNDLRIEYSIKKIEHDLKFRKYTIKAISREVGFNSSEAFSNAFKKKTGIYPSYFIKNLDKLENR